MPDDDEMFDVGWNPVRLNPGNKVGLLISATGEACVRVNGKIKARVDNWSTQVPHLAAEMDFHKCKKKLKDRENILIQNH